MPARRIAANDRVTTLGLNRADKDNEIRLVARLGAAVRDVCLGFMPMPQPARGRGVILPALPVRDTDNTRRPPVTVVNVM